MLTRTPAQGNFWQREPRAARGLPALAGDISVDVAVIGAGYTGLAAAYHLKAADPSLYVAVLESETVGFGASGRNAGFVMTLFGASVGLMKSLHGGDKVREAHDYMVNSIAGARSHDRRARDRLRLRAHAASSRWRRRRATSRASRMRSTFSASWASRATGGSTPSELAARVRSPTFLGGCSSRGAGCSIPRKWVDALRRLAAAQGRAAVSKARA